MSDRIHICSPRRNRIVRAASMLMAVLLVVGTPAAFPSMSAGALTENEIKQKLDKLKKEQEQLKKQISENSGKIDSLQEDVANYRKQISLVVDQIELVSNQIDGLNAKIVAAELAIKHQDKEIEEKTAANKANYEKLSRRMQAINKGGNLSFLQMLMDTDNYTDYLLKSKLMERIAQSDQALIDSLDKEIQNINQEKDKLAAQMEEISSQKAGVEIIQQENETRKRELDSLYKQVQKKELELQKQVKQDEETLKKREKEEAALEDELRKLSQQGGYDGKYTDGTMFWPVPAVHNISSGFGMRWGKLHKGIDIANGKVAVYGQNVVAAADGVVTKAYTADTWGSGYGYHVMISHGQDTKGREIVTLYAHNSKILVKVGDIVKGGETVISKAGDTGNVTGPHLHFEVRVNGTPVDPIANGYVKVK